MEKKNEKTNEKKKKEKETYWIENHNGTKNVHEVSRILIFIPLMISRKKKF